MYFEHMLADAGETSLDIWEGEILDQVRIPLCGLFFLGHSSYNSTPERSHYFCAFYYLNLIYFLLLYSQFCLIHVFLHNEMTRLFKLFIAFKRPLFFTFQSDDRVMLTCGCIFQLSFKCRQFIYLPQHKTLSKQFQLARVKLYMATHPQCLYGFFLITLNTKE